jgi:hypothetical protein
MQINFRSILYNYFRNIFHRVLRNASETGGGITRCCGGQHATTAALLIAIVARILTGGARACNGGSMHKRYHQERLHGGHQSVVAGCSTFTMHYTMYMVDSIINVYDRSQICFEMYFET